jgi:hypothetical protein
MGQWDAIKALYESAFKNYSDGIAKSSKGYP